MNELEEWKALLRRDPRFSLETYRFVQEALEYVNFDDPFAASPSDEDEESEFGDEMDGHVSGQDLCRGIVDYAAEQYGFMAREVLAQLGLRKTGDIGDVVYNLIRLGQISQSPQDRREDFDDVFDLGAALDEKFKFEYEKRKK